MSTIQLKDISKSYNGRDFSVKDINLSIEDGEFIVLVGPSGCGKSTTLRLIAGLEKPTEGELKIGDRIMTNASPQERDLSFVFQDYALYPHMTVFDNLAYPLKMRKLPETDIDTRVQSVSALLAIDDLLTRKPQQLSGGQKQRVALGRAIIREPNAFLMDEPLSNLDAKLRVQMRYEISQLHQKLQTTIVYVTHDQTEAMTMSDRIVVMNEGFIQQIGTADEIYQTPANIFVAEFMGTPKINLFSGVLTDQAIKLIPGKVSQTESTSTDQLVKIGVRPENLRLISGNAYKITLIENLGNQQYVYIENKDERIIVLGEPESDYSIGQAVDLEVINSAKVNVFDAKTSELLLMNKKLPLEIWRENL